MKIKLLITFLLIAATSAFAQDGCSKFRTGTFKVTDPKSGQVCIITRTGDTQTEKMEESDDTYDFDVKWLDDCTYVVTPTPASVAKNKDLMKAGTMTVMMSKVKDSSYVQTIKVENYPTFKRTDTVHFVRERREVMQHEHIETLCLKLRIVTPEVYNHAMDNFSDSELLEFFGLDEAGLAKQKSRQNGGLTTFNKSFLYFYPIEKSTGKVIGWCGYHTWYTEHNRAEVGYHLNADEYKRKGYMTETLAAVLAYGFNKMNLHRVEALTATYNTASIKTLEKSGFTYEGLLREHYLVGEKHEDSPIYSLLRHEFPGTIHLREATVHDIEVMSAIRLAVKENPLNNPALVTRQDYEDYLTTYGKGWVAEMNGKIAGFAIVGLQQKNIWALFVEPAFERSGIGRKLHDTMLDWYFAQTDEEVWLSTDPQTRAAGFYRKAGWKDAGMHGNEAKFIMSASDWKGK